MSTLDYSTKDRISSMWTSESGLQYKSNIITKIGGTIPLHAHSYSHDGIITSGWWLVADEAPDGIIQTYQMATTDFKPTRTDIAFNPIGFMIVIPAWHKHSFTLLEPGSTGVGSQICVWAGEPDTDDDGC